MTDYRFDEHMSVSRSHFRSSADGLALHHRVWEPRQAAEAVVIVTHGLGDHGGRYAGLAMALTDDGNIVHALDQRGHGLSDGPRATVRHFDDPVDDLGSLIVDAAAETPSKPVFLIGHSWGALLSLTYAVRHGQWLSGLIIAGTASRPAVPPIVRASAKFLARVAPEMGTKRLPLESTSRDAETLAAFNTDPLVFRGRVRAATAAASLDAMTEVARKLPRLRVPILILHGTGDIIAPHANSRYVHDRIGSTDKQLELYPGWYHQLFNEPDRTIVLNRITTWIRARR